MEFWDIIAEIWKQPWYKVMIIAAADDIILLIKMWPCWVGLIFLSILATMFGR